jgi:Na+/proline symporter
MSRVLKVGLLSLALAVALVALLTGLLWLSVDPVDWDVSVGPSGPGHHGRPVLSWADTLVWLALLLSYSALAPAILGRVLGRSRIKALKPTMVLMLLLTALVLLIHPLLMAVILPEGAREGFFSTVEQVPFLREIHFSWGLRRSGPWVAGLVWLATLLATMVSKHDRVDSRSSRAAAVSGRNP